MKKKGSVGPFFLRVINASIFFRSALTHYLNVLVNFLAAFVVDEKNKARPFVVGGIMEPSAGSPILALARQDEGSSA